MQGCLAEQCRAAEGKPGAQLGVHQEGKLAPAALSASKLLVFPPSNQRIGFLTY